MADEPVEDDSARTAAIQHVLREIHPDRPSAHVIDAVTIGDGTLFGIKVDAHGFLSQAKYVLVVVDESGTVTRWEQCDRRRLSRRLDEARSSG